MLAARSCNVLETQQCRENRRRPLSMVNTIVRRCANAVSCYQGGKGTSAREVLRTLAVRILYNVSTRRRIVVQGSINCGNKDRARRGYFGTCGCSYTTEAVIGKMRSWARDIEWRAVELISTNLISRRAAQIECDFV